MENQEIINTEVKEKSFFQRMTKSNRIFMIVSYSIIAALILTTILLAVIPVYTGIKYQETPDRIVLKTQTETLTLYADTESTKADFNKIWAAYNKSGSPVVIDTIFNGYAGRGMEAVYNQSSSKSYGNLASDTTYSVAFYWDEAQLMVNGNGQQFTYELSGTQVTEPVYYTAATFAVTKDDKAQLSYGYLRKSTASVGSTSTKFYYTGYNNYYVLYKAIDTLYDEGKFSV